jgi:hypothetical protein
MALKMKPDISGGHLKREHLSSARNPQVPPPFAPRVYPCIECASAGHSLPRIADHDVARLQTPAAQLDSRA